MKDLISFSRFEGGLKLTTLFFHRATLRGKASGALENTVVYPPNGVIPFHGFAMFCAPFCYVYDDPEQLYLGMYGTTYLTSKGTCKFT